MIFAKAAYYGAEITAYSKSFPEELEGVSALSGNFHAYIKPSIIGSAVFGAATYDMATAGLPKHPIERRKVRFLSGVGMLYLDLLDDGIDDPRLALSGEEKASAINNDIAATWVDPPQSSEPLSRISADARVVGAFLKSISATSRAGLEYSRVIHEYLSTQAAHAVAKTYLDLLESVIALGRPCGSIMAATVELIRGGWRPCHNSSYRSYGYLWHVT